MFSDLQTASPLNGFSTILKKISLRVHYKLRQEEKRKGYKYSVWEHHPNAFHILGEDTFMQKVHYIHQNPVRAGLVERAEDYRFSSVRLWKGNPLEDEPFITDHMQIKWRAAA